MNYAEKQQLEDALKTVTLTVLNQLIAHNIKGAELVKKGVEEIINIKEEVDAHYETLKTLLTLLRPVFDLARDWLVECYHHLVALFDWAKAKWHEIFG